jgi:ketol-acid reductoisomerase
MKIDYDKVCPPGLGEPVAVIGYGRQGRAHARNLREPVEK